MFSNKVTVASDGLTVRDLGDSVPIKGTNVYMIPRFHSPSKLPQCISTLVHDANIRQTCSFNGKESAILLKF